MKFYLVDAYPVTWFIFNIGGVFLTKPHLPHPKSVTPFNPCIGDCACLMFNVIVSSICIPLIIGIIWLLLYREFDVPCPLLCGN